MSEEINWDGRPLPVLDEQAIGDFLYFGYVPRVDPEHPLSFVSEWSGKSAPRAEVRSDAELVRQGVAALKASVEDFASRPGPGGAQVVFLSGGLDSRAILGGLLEMFDTSEIRTATFGLPGEQDYAFGPMLAASVGVSHEQLETFSVPWTTENLVDSVLAREYLPLSNVFGQRYLSYCLHRRFGPQNSFWDGLGGGAVGGGLLTQSDEMGDWHGALEDFVRRNRVRGAEALVPPGYDPLASLPPAPLMPDERLTYSDQLNFALRQACYIATRLMRGYTTKTPFLSRHWLDFMLAVPPRYRDERYLYIEVLKEAFPRLFSLPTTTAGGLPVTAPRWRRREWELRRKVARKVPGLAQHLPGADMLLATAHTKFAIFDSMTQRPEIRSLVEENIGDLHRRGALSWLDVRTIWQEYLAGHAAHASSIQALLSLELNIKAMDRLRSSGGVAHGVGAAPAGER